MKHKKENPAVIRIYRKNGQKEMASKTNSLDTNCMTWMREIKISVKRRFIN
jgi:hypothetical protein